VRRKLLNGVLSALVTLAALYAFGAIGLLAERLTGREVLSSALALFGLALALGLGVLVLCRLSRRTGSPIAPADPVDPDSETTNPDPGTAADPPRD
jgi:hypothetical protein